MKKKVLPALLCALCLLCGALSSCQSARKDKPDLSPVLPAVCRTGAVRLLDRFQAELTRTVSFPLDIWKGQELSLELEERRTNVRHIFEVTRIRVCLGGEVIQTILPRDLEELAEYGGLYDDERSAQAWPWVQDLNFDGAADFGLPCIDSPIDNLPCLYFLWDREKEQYTPLAVLCGIEMDQEAQQLVDTVCYGSMRVERSRYAWEDGKLVLVCRERENFPL